MNEIVRIANEIAVQVHNIPAGFWQALLASGVLSPLISVWKHFRITKKEKQIGEVAMYAITIGVAFGAALLQYLFTAHPDNPKVIALHTAIIGFTLQPVYLLAVKPLWSFFGKKFSEASQLENELKAASLVPAEGLPLAGTSLSATAAQDKITQQVADDFNT